MLNVNENIICNVKQKENIAWEICSDARTLIVFPRGENVPYADKPLQLTLMLTSLLLFCPI